MTFPPFPKSSNSTKGIPMNVDSSLSASYPQAISAAQIDPALVPATLTHSVICNGSPSASFAPSANCKSAPTRPRPFTPPPWKTPSARCVSSTCDIRYLPQTPDCDVDAAPTIRDNFAQRLQTSYLPLLKMTPSASRLFTSPGSVARSALTHLFSSRGTAAYWPAFSFLSRVDCFRFPSPRLKVKLTSASNCGWLSGT